MVLDEPALGRGTEQEWPVHGSSLGCQAGPMVDEMCFKWRTSFSSRWCRKTLMTRMRLRMGGSCSISARTCSAACGPLAASKLMSKLRPLAASLNLMMGTLALAMTCAPREGESDMVGLEHACQAGRHYTLKRAQRHCWPGGIPCMFQGRQTAQDTRAGLPLMLLADVSRRGW